MFSQADIAGSTEEPYQKHNRITAMTDGSVLLVPARLDCKNLMQSPTVSAVAKGGGASKSSCVAVADCTCACPVLLADNASVLI